MDRACWFEPGQKEISWENEGKKCHIMREGDMPRNAYAGQWGRRGGGA